MNTPYSFSVSGAEIKTLQFDELKVNLEEFESPPIEMGDIPAGFTGFELPTLAFNLIFYNEINAPLTLYLDILGKTDECLKLNPIDQKIKGLGINCKKINGHKIEDIFNALNTLESKNGLTCILADTIKGKGTSIMEHKNTWHYLNKMNEEQIKKIRDDLSK